jgi:hypothetical protein
MLLTRAASIKEQTSGALTHVLQLAGAGISSRGLTLFENSVRRVTKTTNVLTNNPDFLLNQTHSVRVSNDAFGAIKEVNFTNYLVLFMQIGDND